MDNDKYIGRLLDNRYEILEVIGVGGMAVVYKARCHRLNRLVAIKILKDEYSQDDEFRRRFHAEGQAVAMVSHPNIVSVYDVSTANDADYIVMELIDGISLKQYMEKKGILNWKETLHFAIQIGKALEHAHSKGIVHRDIKPHNVMVLKNGSVKVADFGIARLMSESNTLTREALGSVHYISPEQAKGGRVDSRSDIYSLGVVMYEMMTGRPPYNGESPVAVAIQHINGGAPMPTTLNPNIPGGLEQIIMKGMAHDPSERYASATAMLYDMDEFRKLPSILFDYNTPPTDAVTRLQKTPEERQASAAAAAAGAVGAAGATQVMKKTTAERIAGKTERRVGQGTRRTAAVAAGSAAAAAKSRRKTTPKKREEDEDEDKSKVAAIAIIASSAVVILAILIILLVLLNGGLFDRSQNRVDVPDFRGENFELLIKEYQYSNALQIKQNTTTPYSYSPDYDDGDVMAQTPAPGENVVKGTTVWVTVSWGAEPEVKTMVDLAGKTEQEARDRLDGMGLNLTVSAQYEYDDKVPAGCVISTTPTEGTTLYENGTVTLVVSRGPEIIEIDMLDVVGDDIMKAKNKLTMQNLNLTFDEKEEESDEFEEGQVIRTEPAAGEKIKTGDTIVLYVSTGPKKAKMPQVVGESLDTALKILNAAGFTNIKYEEYLESEEPKDEVLSQSVEAEQQVPVSTEIVLKLSYGYVTKTVKRVFKLMEDVTWENPYSVVIKDAETGEVIVTETLPVDATEIEVELTGYGIKNYEIWIDDLYFDKVEVDFSEG